MSSNRNVKARWIRLVARILGLIAVSAMLVMLVGAAFTEGLGQDPVVALQGITLGLLGLVALAGVIVSWWRERLAAILLVSVSAGLGIHIGICAGHSHFLAWLMVGLPYLIIGLLFYFSWRLSKPEN